MFGNSVSIAGDYAIVRAYYKNSFEGAAYLFERAVNGQWSEVQKITASDKMLGDFFGVSVSIAGDQVIVGAFGKGISEGGAYIFKLTFPVSTAAIQAASKWSVFPNPAQDFIHFKGLETPQLYQIIDVLGRTVQSGTAMPNEAITVVELNAGWYSIQLDDGGVQPFLKR